MTLKRRFYSGTLEIFYALISLSCHVSGFTKKIIWHALIALSTGIRDTTLASESGGRHMR